MPYQPPAPTVNYRTGAGLRTPPAAPKKQPGDPGYSDPRYGEGSRVPQTPSQTNYLGPGAVGANVRANIAAGMPTRSVTDTEVLDLARLGAQPGLAPGQTQLGGTTTDVLNQGILDATAGRAAPTMQLQGAANTFRDVNAAGRGVQTDALRGLQLAGQGIRQQQGALASQLPQLGLRPAQDQRQLAGILESAALGRGPTAASSLFQNALDQSISAQRAQAATARGQGAGAAQRTAAATGAQMGLQATSEAAALRAQEQQAAQELLRTALATERGQALGTAQTQAGVLEGVRTGDVGQAEAVAGQAAALREADIRAGGLSAQTAEATGRIILDSRATDDQKLSTLAALGIDQQRLELMYQQLVQQGNLEAAQTIGNFVIGVRNNRVADQNNDFNAGQALLGGLMNAIPAAGAMALSGGIAGGGAPAAAGIAGAGAPILGGGSAPEIIDPFAQPAPSASYNYPADQRRGTF